MKFDQPKGIRSLDVSSFAHVKKTTPKSQLWDYIGPRRGRRARGEGAISIAIITPQPGKGFSFQGVTYPKLVEAVAVIKGATGPKGKPLYTHYRQGGMLTKRGEQNKLIPLAA